MKPTAPSPDHPCLICGKRDREKAMCFRGEDWCCELHRKEIERRRLASVDRLLGITTEG